ncbi:MAG TPA: MobF family relaxase [Capillimicrobium sp.]|nr:MobF family relaxase [Capillimicrobium sp.]
MLSIGKLTGGADSARYYEQTVATGREDYYSGQGESAGRWIGDGAQALGIEGSISEGELQTLLVDGRHPLTGELLRAVGGTSVQGFDLTFSAPKSVSVLFAVGDDALRRAVSRSHDLAVQDAVGYLEREAVQVRRGKGGAVKEHAGGLIAGAYRHRTSRAGDPQLHTHVVAANLAQGADGRWTALHGAALYAHAKTASYLYQAALREQLAIELGVEWGPVVKGIAEVQGIPRDVLAHFSQRRAEIVEAMAQTGGRSARAAQIAALQTRRAKDYGVQESTIYERWQARAAEHGLTPAVLAEVLERYVESTRDDFVQAAAALMAGDTGLTAHSSTFTRREALQARAELHPAGATTRRIEELTDRWLASDLVVKVDGEQRPVGRHEVIATRRGTRVADVEDRYTTPGMLATERDLIEGGLARMGEGVGVAGREAIEVALTARPYLADEQRALVRALTTSGDGVQVVLAKAGAGKTTAMDAAREAWERSGVAVQGSALGSYATKELRDSGIRATTIARLLIDIERDGGLPRGSVLIVDEAGMVGTRTLAALAGAADRSRAKLVLVGDDKQLPEIDAGGGFRGLARRLGAAELQHNRRQHDPEDRRALDAHRAGRPEELVESLRRRGRIAVAPDVDQTRQALVADWWDGAQVEGIENVAMIALRRSEVRELNDLARDRMRAAGRLASQELRVDDRAFAVGDRIVTRTNAPRLGVVNGSRGTIAAIHQDHSIALRLDDGDHVLLHQDYVSGRRDHTPNIDHGYAITANGIQGGTVQRSYVLASEDTYQEWGYVAASRHRAELRFYVTVPDIPHDEQGRRDLTDGDPLAGLTRALGQSRAKELAMDLANQTELHALPEDRLFSEAARLRELLTTAPTTGPELDRLADERSEMTAQLQAARARLLAVERQRHTAPWRERKSLREQADSHSRAVQTWQQRVDTLDQQAGDVIARRGDPNAWLADHRQDARLLAGVERELARRAAIRRQEAMRMVVVDPPAYVRDAIGRRPTDDLAKQHAWDRAARTIESYRQSHGATIAHDQAGLGPRPIDPSSRRAYVAASRDIDAVRIDLGLIDVATREISASRSPER